MNVKLTAQELSTYQRDGYLVLRGLFDDADLLRLDTAVTESVPSRAYAPGKHYPEPAKYTLSAQCPADPNLAYIAEHYRVIAPVEQLLGGASHLTAYVVYVRTPQDKGSLAHNDYKRWRPVGSSMNWLFTIVPLTDFDRTTGPLLIAPGSHQPELVEDRGEKTLHRAMPRRPEESEFIDPELKRGDLLLMNMYTWHWAPPNVSAHNRIGIFNKYAAATAPPATGYFINASAVANAFSASGRRLLARCTDTPLTSTRLFCTRENTAGTQLLLVKSVDGNGWSLPGGPGEEETAIPGWDVGSRIGSLNEQCEKQLGVVMPWVSYVDDFDEEGGICRVYGYSDAKMPAVPALADGRARWIDGKSIHELSIAGSWSEQLPVALQRWSDSAVMRGKGLSQTQSLNNQYAV